MDTLTLNGTLDQIDDADDDQAANLAIAAIRRVGFHGRRSAQLMLDRINGDPDSDLVEGLAQIMAVEGVISGRTDSL